MITSLGRVVAQLAEPSESLPPRLVDLINKNIKPPVEVTADDVFVRAMYVVSDQVNSFGGRFPVEEHERLAELLIDSPVMVGHRKDKLPVGRNFNAETIERDGQPWVKSYFYWLRSADGAEQLRDNIDGGIYKECSIAFMFRLPECSVCGQDIRQCKHEPFEEYEREGTKGKCYFNYRKIERVLETSLVYRGSVPQTSLTKGLDESSDQSKPVGELTTGRRLRTVRNLESLNQDRRYLVVPRYDGLRLTARISQGDLLLEQLNGAPLSEQPVGAFQPLSFQSVEPVYGVLVAYRGRERCSVSQLQKYLVDRSGPATRLVFNVYPGQGIVTLAKSTVRSPLDIRIIPNRTVTFFELDRKAREIMTRDGVEVWPMSSTSGLIDLFSGDGFNYVPQLPVIPESQTYTLRTDANNSCAELILNQRDKPTKSFASNERSYKITGYNVAGCARDGAFVTREILQQNRSIQSIGQPDVCGRLVTMTSLGGSLMIECEGELNGKYVLRPINLAGEDCSLFYRLCDPADEDMIKTEGNNHV